MSSFFKKIVKGKPSAGKETAPKPNKKPGRFGESVDANDVEEEEEQSEGQGSKYEGPGGKTFLSSVCTAKLN